jgi:TP901 family phage tail tape measure protein
MAKVDYEALLRLTATDQTGAAFAAATQRMRAFERESQRANAAGLATYNPRRQFVGFSGSTFAAAGAAVSRFRMQMGQAVAVFEGARFLKNDYVGGAAFVRRMNELQQVMGASDEQMKRAVPVYRQIAQDLALPVDQIIRGAEEFAKIGGRTSDQILAILPTVAAAARASGSDVQDFAQMTNGLMSQMKISGDQLPRVFDELITAGRNGQAEIKEFAHTFPMLTAAAARLGYTGVEGVERLAAVLEVVRNDTSNTDEAAQHLSETMRKVFSEQTDKAFAQHGFPNLQRRLLQVRAEGGDVLAYTADIVRHLQEKGVSLEELFGNDAQVIQTWTSLIQRYGEVRQRMDQMKQAADVTNQALRKLLNDPQADIDRLSNKFIELQAEDLRVALRCRRARVDSWGDRGNRRPGAPDGRHWGPQGRPLREIL